MTIDRSTDLRRLGASRQALSRFRLRLDAAQIVRSETVRRWHYLYSALNGSLSALTTNPIALPDALEEQKSAIRIRAVAYPMGRMRADSIACARSYHFVALKLACHNSQRALKNKIVVSALAVLMPGDYVARREREEPRLHVATYHHGLYAFDLIIRLFGCHSRFRVHGVSIPTLGTSTFRAAQARPGQYRTSWAGIISELSRHARLPKQPEPESRLSRGSFNCCVLNVPAAPAGARSPSHVGLLPRKSFASTDSA